MAIPKRRSQETPSIQPITVRRRSVVVGSTGRVYPPRERVPSKHDSKWLGIVALTALASVAAAQRQATDAETAVSNGLSALRSMDDESRTKATQNLALQIRKLPAGPSKVNLAYSLSNLATEGDFGYVTLKRVSDTLADAIKEAPPVSKGPYVQLANLYRYEGIANTLDSAAYKAALAEVDALAWSGRKPTSP